MARRSNHQHYRGCCSEELSESSTATTTKELLIEDLNLDKDSDQDGLTDKEEALLGTKSDTADSDGDGYDDLTEIRSGYDPAGQGKLTNNRNLKLVEHGPWSVIVPASRGLSNWVVITPLFFVLMMASLFN